MTPCDFHALLSVFAPSCENCQRASEPRLVWRNWHDTDWPGPLPAELFESENRGEKR